MLGSDDSSSDYEHLLVTEEFVGSAELLDPPLTEEDVEGVLGALEDLDAEPTNFRNRLHRLDRELRDWWSLTPPEPAHQSLRVLIRPEQDAFGRGRWRIGPITWHYAR